MHVLVASSKHSACNLKAAFGVLFPPLHNTGCKTDMLQSSILQIRSELWLCTARITFISPVPWGGRVTFVGRCASVPSPLRPAQGALVVLGFFLRALGAPAPIRHLATAAEVETSSVCDAHHRDAARNGVSPPPYVSVASQTSAACELYVSWWMGKECWARWV